ncbi:Hypothetical predicted protein [Octopus vulgaris]|uniref:Uncharacterized protein n=1 Tax=Octopus vulgaris TaxID=6645 RepID=A0AA36BBV3_OCTVU|nr:Hypothetical predicted protein [Octopus vulgaris]
MAIQNEIELCIGEFSGFGHVLTCGIVALNSNEAKLIWRKYNLGLYSSLRNEYQSGVRNIQIGKRHIFPSTELFSRELQPAVRKRYYGEGNCKQKEKNL